MPRKKTIQEIKDFIEKYDINHECTLLSDTYNGGSAYLQFKCNLCGNTFQKTYKSLRDYKSFRCRSCSSKNGKQPTKKSLEYVKQFLIDNNADLELLSTEYINNRTPLTFKCLKCGSEFQRSLDKLQQTKNFCCIRCSHKINGFQLKYDVKYVDNLLEELKYTRLSEYINSYTPIKVKCSKGHEFNFYLNGYLNDGRQCLQCYYESISGENSPHWKGGGKTLADSLRYNTNKWRADTLKEQKKCDITGKENDLIVHHLSKNYLDIVDEALKNLNLPKKDALNNYTVEEQAALKKEIKKLHENVSGVVLTKDIHQLFHSIYGNLNNTPGQYFDFKEKIQKGEIELNGVICKQCSNRCS